MESFGADLEVMRRVPLSDEHVAAIRALAVERIYEKGAFLTEVGQPLDRFVYLLDGEVEVVNPYTNERLLNATLGPTQFMGEIAFLNGGTSFLPMRASKPTRTLEVPRADMLQLMARTPELSDHVITVFAARRRRQFELKNSAIKIVGADRDPAVQKVESFLSRNRVPFQSYDLDGADPESAQVCNLASHEPAVIFSQNEIVADPTPRKIARLVGLDLDLEKGLDVDLLIVGGGPAGVAAAVYAGAEGVPALVVEDSAIGGQAGASSRIENYMGFPTGISGADLVYRGEIQAMKFGTRFAMPRRVDSIERRSDGKFCARLDDGEEICARAVLVATGVCYRKLPVARLEDFEGAGVFYAATEMEARFCRRTEAIVVGGGNSAGQAAMYLSRIAAHVHVLVRGASLADSMSDYLSRRLEADPRITIRYRSEIAELEGGDRLEAAIIRGPDGDERVETRAVFAMIGAAPNTEWLTGLVELDEKGFVKTGAAVGVESPFETSAPGVFAVGDVRAGSVKRVASAVGEGSVVISAIWTWLNAPRR